MEQPHPASCNSKPCDEPSCTGLECPFLRPHCVRCGYNLCASFDTSRCPECGTAFSDCSRQGGSGGPLIQEPSEHALGATQKPTRGLWQQTGGRFLIDSRRTLSLVAVATLLLGLASYMMTWQVHQTEWVFASDADVRPVVAVYHDSSRRHRPPDLNTEGLTGAYSFGCRSFSASFGAGGGAKAYECSEGESPIYWTGGMSSRMVAPANLPIRAHYCEREWAPRDGSNLVFAAVFLTPTALLATGVNLLVLPRLLRWISPDGLWCGPACRQGFHRITRRTCMALMVVAFVWIVGAMNPGNWLIDYFGLSRRIAQVLLVAVVAIPGIAVAYGIHADRAAILFPRRRLAVILAVTCQVVAMLGWHGAVAVAAIWPIAKSSSDGSAAQAEGIIELNGKPAPGFSLPMMGGEETAVEGEAGKEQTAGRTVSLADFRNKKPVLLAFWATWCSPCLEEMPALCKLHEEFSPQGLAVVGISTDREVKAVKSLLKRNPLPYVVLHDEEHQAAAAYGIKQLPYTFLMDRTGTVVRTWRGWSDGEEKEIREAVVSMLKN